MRQHVAPIKVRVSTRQVLAERRVLARAPLTPRRCAANAAQVRANAAQVRRARTGDV